MAEPPKIELSLVAAIATGAVAFCVALGAFFYARSDTSQIDAMNAMNAATTPPAALESAPILQAPAAPIADAKPEAKLEAKPETKETSKKPKAKPASDDAAPAARKVKAPKADETKTEAKSESEPAPAPKKKADKVDKDRGKSVQQILDELGEEQLRR
jgi:type IV secretory pathway VirB10-like protein